jgi:murein L,D-transpeptidase YafK
MNARLLAGGLVALCTVLALALPADAGGQSAPLGTPIPHKPLGSPVDGEGGLPAFLKNQLSFARVAEAREVADAPLRLLFHERALTYPAPEIYLRVFKHERVMELWVRPRHDSTFTLLKEYPVCALPGQLGPKQQMGDFQVPEGFYFIDEFNPESAYHLSLRVSYPNLSDRLRREAIRLGGDIYVHGGCETVGCVPIENDNIREVYWLAVQAMDAGQRVIPIHIFPSRMDERSMRWLERTYDPDPELHAFWRNLAEGFTYFEETHRVPWITVAADGRYAVPPIPALAEAPADSAAPTPASTAPLVPLTPPPSDSVAPDSALVDGIVPDSIVPDSVGAGGNRH